MMSELEYYKTVAFDAVAALRFAYWNDALRRRINDLEPCDLDDETISDFYEDCDDEAEGKTIEECHLSYYQFRDFIGDDIGSDCEPYDDYLAYCSNKGDLPF